LLLFLCRSIHHCSEVVVEIVPTRFKATTRRHSVPGHGPEWNYSGGSTVPGECPSSFVHHYYY
jgi:hypothetical protein